MVQTSKDVHEKVRDYAKHRGIIFGRWVGIAIEEKLARDSARWTKQL